MTQISSYHRPPSPEKAVELLARPGITTAVIGGGTYLNAHRPENIDEIVDLQAAGLDYLEREGGRLAVGAMTRIQTLVESEQVPELLRETGILSGPNTFRNQGTVGGVVVGADPESEMLAGLLVLEAEVTVLTESGSRTVSLPEFLSDVAGTLGKGIVTKLTLVSDGNTAHERVARTPVDAPIVAAVARKAGDGRTLLALCGVALTPILADPEQLDLLNPPADFRGSGEYRREMATLLAKRVLAQLD